MESKLTRGLRFSANLGFLWANLSLPDAISRASSAGFEAIECHWPYDHDPALIGRLCNELNLKRISLNTRAHNHFGTAAIPTSVQAARADIDEAIDYARMAGFGAVHVMTGKTGEMAAKDTFVDNLWYASQNAPELTFLIEPLNAHDVPGYFLSDLDQAMEIFGIGWSPECETDVWWGGVDVRDAFRRTFDHIGHIQFAGLPNRGRPDHGTLNLKMLLPWIHQQGWRGFFGAEYRSESETEQTLGWLQEWKKLP